MRITQTRRQVIRRMQDGERLRWIADSTNTKVRQRSLYLGRHEVSTTTLLEVLSLERDGTIAAQAAPRTATVIEYELTPAVEIRTEAYDRDWPHPERNIGERQDSGTRNGPAATGSTRSR